VESVQVLVAREEITQPVRRRESQVQFDLVAVPLQQLDYVPDFPGAAP
jgi:hypothetical protein